MKIIYTRLNCLVLDTRFGMDCYKTIAIQDIDHIGPVWYVAKTDYLCNSGVISCTQNGFLIYVMVYLLYTTVYY